MSALIPFDRQKQIALVQQMNDNQLDEEVSRSLVMTVTGLERLAIAIVEGERRGRTYSIDDIPMLLVLQKIGRGSLLAGIVARFLTKPGYVFQLGGLPLQQQQDIIDGKGVLLVTFRNGKKESHYNADPLKLEPLQFKQVFAKDHIRDEAEQVMWLENQITKQQIKNPSSKDPVRIGPWEVEPGIIKLADKAKIGTVFTVEMFRDVIRAATNH